MTSAQLQNIYYERKTGTPRPCYICNRPTQTVLSTLKTEDFLYTCDGHLTDPASPIAPSAAATTGPTADDIKKVISDYHSREARKANKDKDKDQSKDGDGEKDRDKDGAKKNLGSPSTSTPSTPTVPVASTPPVPTHKKFALHRHIFEMRKTELRRKEQGAKAKEVSKGMPQVPRTSF
ncbi:hypothetical protein I317_01425 [Kwoniella heveanensis CBS 569]|nr:hypothetical protein I317_01425 [Kwoniella heveanensis CBS 569]